MHDNRSNVFIFKVCLVVVSDLMIRIVFRIQYSLLGDSPIRVRKKVSGLSGSCFTQRRARTDE